MNIPTPKSRKTSLINLYSSKTARGLVSILSMLSGTGPILAPKNTSFSAAALFAICTPAVIISFTWDLDILSTMLLAEKVFVLISFAPADIYCLWISSMVSGWLMFASSGGTSYLLVV